MGRKGIEHYSQLVRDIKGMQGKSEKVIKRTLSDIRTRVPGWVASEVVKVYGLPKSEVKPSKTGSGEIGGDKVAGKKALGRVRVHAQTVDSILIFYRGRVLTPTHFGMSPKAPPQGKGYTLKASILRGERATLGKIKRLTKRQRKKLAKNFTRQGTQTSDHSPIMLMNNGGGGYIPFQRKSPRRSDVEAIKTVSLPQMVSSDRTKDAIEQMLTENLNKRFNQHMRSAFK